jgi:gamma-glutamyltranspeptidase/glutathione hydrolase
VILQAMLQAFLNHVVFGRTLQQAVEEPRVAGFSFPGSFYPHVEVPGRLSVEARIPPEVREDLAARGHDVELWDPWDFDMGSVGMARSYVGAGRAPRLEAAADPRRTAYAFGA